MTLLTLGTVDAEWSPEVVIETSALDEPSAACFLHQNYLESFQDIDDLADYANCLSDASVVVDAQRGRPWQIALLPHVGSLAGRGLVTNNRHPAPSRFTQTHKPHPFAVERDALERAQRAVRAFQRQEKDGVLGYALGSTNLSCEMLPFLRLITAQCGSQGYSLNPDQWQSIKEITTFTQGAGSAGPRCGQYCSGVVRLSTCSQPDAAPLEDEIEE